MNDKKTNITWRKKSIRKAAASGILGATLAIGSIITPSLLSKSASAATRLPAAPVATPIAAPAPTSAGGFVGAEPTMSAKVSGWGG